MIKHLFLQVLSDEAGKGMIVISTFYKYIFEVFQLFYSVSLFKLGYKYFGGTKKRGQEAM